MSENLEQVLAENAALRRELDALRNENTRKAASTGTRRTQRLARFLASNEIDKVLNDLATKSFLRLDRMLEVLPDQSYCVVSVLSMNLCTDAPQEYYTIAEIEAIRAESKVTA